MNKKLKILICPLNWGLGHATRCAPIIEKLVELGHEITIAGDGNALMLLNRQFPTLQIKKLAALDIRYSKYFFFGLALQSFKILDWIKNDKRMLNEILGKSSYDLIISDSRPAINSKKIKSIFIINQPNPIIPWYYGSRIIKYLLKLVYKQYDEIWIPDIPGENSLGGKLIEISRTNIIKYIGWLSRLMINKKRVESKGKIAAIISGPEPSRSVFKNKLDLFLPHENVVIIGGDLQNKIINSRYIPYLDPNELTRLIESAEYIISRGGYSSLMDLAFSNKKLILVPTPGQTEQEYLANRLAEKDYAVIWDMNRDTWDEIKLKSDGVKRFDLKELNGKNENWLSEVLMKLEN